MGIATPSKTRLYDQGEFSDAGLGLVCVTMFIAMIDLYFSSNTGSSVCYSQNFQCNPLFSFDNNDFHSD